VTGASHRKKERDNECTLKSWNALKSIRRREKKGTWSKTRKQIHYSPPKGIEMKGWTGFQEKKKEEGSPYSKKTPYIG